MDAMVLKTQQWLNATYGDKTGFGSVDETGNTGWPTIYALTRALQIELGITNTANNFGPSTQAKFKDRWPSGIAKNDNDDNAHGIIQGALWCKGYEAEYGGITTRFTDNVASSIQTLKTDMGIGGDSTVTLDIMECLLSMKQFKLLSSYGGKQEIRQAQQKVNASYRDWTGIIPTDGLYGREMNKALVQVLQALEGYTPETATGYFGSGTRTNLKAKGDITEGNAASNPEWVWLGSTALLCNGRSVTPSTSWNANLAAAIVAFQRQNAISQSGVLDYTTWMSLLTSCGDPDRPCVACDTRFEITDEFANYLKADGYEIVGRYLSEPDQESLSESDYFKALRTGELARIVGHGLRYFPIFQEYSTKLAHFTAETGANHAQKAQAAAERLGIPATVIYFAVDYDATDTEVESNILPYFQAVSENLSGGYRVGVYGTRNVCTRVYEAGYAVASFVSDMSTGYSGNLGFTMPTKWAFDQFAEMNETTGKYHGQWDLDRVAYSGRVVAVDTVEEEGVLLQSVYPYEAPGEPTANALSNLTKIVDVIPLIQQLETAYDEWTHNYTSYVSDSRYTLRSVEEGVINYLSKYYTKIDISSTDNYERHALFALAVAAYDANFGSYFEQNYADVATNLDQFIGDNHEDVKDSIGGRNDLPHMAYTLYAYAYGSVSPQHWTGWGGDLATGMADLHNIMINHPSLDTHRVAYLIIGADRSSISSYLTDNGVPDDANFSLDCNYTDLCDDADAIAISQLLATSSNGGIHTLSDAMSSYYGSVTKQIRYTAYADDGLDYTSYATLYETAWDKMDGTWENLQKVGLLSHFAGASTDEEKQICCSAFAHYLLNMSK